MKRFYKAAAVVATEGSQEQGFIIELDGKEIKTPEKRPNLSPTRALAEAICAEWNEQGDKIDPASMLMAKLQNTALDRVHTRRSDLIAELVKYAGTDLLCYRAEFPEDLAQQQAGLWQPLLDWVGQNHDIKLVVTTGILHVPQDADELEKLGVFLGGLDSFHLAAFHNITTLCGSVSIALNVLGGNISAEQAWTAAELDENYQTRQWGLDDEAVIRQKNMRADLDAAVQFLSLL
ncbi:MAG: hypothetical protein L3J58_05790 [Emcibacter sp.]|nr:hypothetical protein [Emcibacter sp.]